MPRRIDPDLLRAVEAEFELGIRPARVLEHCQSIETPVGSVSIYRLYDAWREFGSVKSGLETRGNLSRVLEVFMVKISCPQFRQIN